jgi:ribose 5-phosphate isomerase A
MAAKCTTYTNEIGYTELAEEQTMEPSPETQEEQYKRTAAEHAVTFVESGMTIGLGTGSTAIWATRRIGQLLRAGQLRDVTGYATSHAVWTEAQQVGIPMLAEELPRGLDITIDGADEVDQSLNLIKGGGGALLREKIVAQASRRVVIVVDESKLSPCLGTRHPLPVEVLPFGWRSQLRFLQSLGGRVLVRHNRDGTPYKSDQSNLILDCDFGPISMPLDLAAQLSARAGIVEHGLFLNLATEVIIGSRMGVRHLLPPFV